MTITVTIPRNPGDLVRLLAVLAEPCLVAAVAAAGLGPLGQALVSGAFRITWQNTDITAATAAR